MQDTVSDIRDTAVNMTGPVPALLELTKDKTKKESDITRLAFRKIPLAGERKIAEGVRRGGTDQWRPLEAPRPAAPSPTWHCHDSEGMEVVSVHSDFFLPFSATFF